MRSNLLAKTTLVVLLALAVAMSMSGCLAVHGYEIYHELSELSSNVQDRQPDQSQQGQSDRHAEHQDRARQNADRGTDRL